MCAGEIRWRSAGGGRRGVSALAGGRRRMRQSARRWRNASMSGGVAMTEPLYLVDAYLRSVATTVVAHAGEAVVLDRTDFYPGGGGQPADVGRHVVGGVDRTVAHASRGEGGAILHALDPADGPPPPV